jgi:hypothetical protein
LVNRTQRHAEGAKTRTRGPRKPKGEPPAEPLDLVDLHR